MSSGYSLSDFLIESDTLHKQLESDENQYEYEAASPASIPLPTKHQIISSLAIQGQWVTSQPTLQVRIETWLNLTTNDDILHLLSPFGIVAM